MDRSPIGSTGTIDLTESGPSVDLNGGVHLLPCTIEYDGPCAVSQYFKPRPTGVEVDGLAVQEAYFRGRKLQGAAVPLPPGYSEALHKPVTAEDLATSSVQEKTQIAEN